MQILDGGRAYDGGTSAGGAALRRRTACRTRARTRRRRRSSAPSRRRGSRSACSSSTATWKIWGNSLGTLDWRADPQNLPAGLTRSPGRAGYAEHGRRRLRQRLRRARRDLRPRARREASRASPSSRATGTASGRATPPRRCRPKPFEPVGLSFVGASLVEPRRDGGLRAPAAQGPSAAAAVPRRPAGRGKPELDVQHAAEARRPVLPRICEERRSRARRARSRIPIARAAPGVRRHGRTRLCEGAAVRGRDAHGVRLHPAAGRRAAIAPTAGRCAIAWST